MSSVAMMAVLFGVLVLALLGYFAFMWTKEKGRSDEEGDDASRQHTRSGAERHRGDGTRGA